MSVFRIHKTENYTVMSNHHFKERGMSLKAKGLLSLMLSLPDTWNYSISGLVTLSKDGKDSVMSALSELEKFGYLSRKQVTNSKGQFSGVEYNIFEIPQSENPTSELPILDKRNEAKALAENRQQLSTKEIKDESIKDLGISSTKKEKDKEEIDSILMYQVRDTELIELYWDYIDVRKDMGVPLTAKTLEILVARAKRLSKNNVKVQKLLLENAIINGWKNIYLPNESELQNVSQEMQNDLKDLLGL